MTTTYGWSNCCVELQMTLKIEVSTYHQTEVYKCHELGRVGEGRNCVPPCSFYASSGCLLVNIDWTSCAEYKFDVEFWKVVMNHLSSLVCWVHAFALVMWNWIPGSPVFLRTSLKNWEEPGDKTNNDHTFSSVFTIVKYFLLQAMQICNHRKLDLKVSIYIHTCSLDSYYIACDALSVFDIEWKYMRLLLSWSIHDIGKWIMSRSLTHLLQLSHLC